MKLLLLVILTACAPFKPIHKTYTGHDDNPTRPYQMVLWDDSGNNQAQDADLAFFLEGQSQPPGVSIINILNWNTIDYTPETYDYSRIAAMIIDEPFLNHLNASGDIASCIMNLKSTISQLRAVAPNSKIWVNFSQPELDYQMSGLGDFIFPEVDVYSVDIYRQYIDPKYDDWLLANRVRPDQKLSMIVSTFYEQGVDDPNEVADMLWDYFNYADAHPEDMYIIVGYKRDAFSQDPGVTYIGESNILATSIQNVWKFQLNKAIVK